MSGPAQIGAEGLRFTTGGSLAEYEAMFARLEAGETVQSQLDLGDGEIWRVEMFAKGRNARHELITEVRLIERVAE